MLTFKNNWGIELSHEKKPPTFHYTGWLIGILIMVYYNPHITGFSTFDLSARETSCTADQHLHDSRALQRNHSPYNWVV